MKFAVVGCGALGSYYGARLCRDNHEVHFLLRSDYETVRRKGVRVLSPEGDFHVNPKCARTPEEIGTADVVLIGLKTTANDQLARLLPPLVGPHTAILTLQNGFGNEEAIAKLFPPAQILGGLCFVCLNRLEPGVILHQAHGRVLMGEYQGWPEPRTHDIASAFRHAGVPCKVAESLHQAHWEKLVWNIPFNGLAVSSSVGIEAFEQDLALPLSPSRTCLTTDKLLADPRWNALVRELMLELISAARAQGYDLSPSLVDRMIKNTEEMGCYRPSTLIDFENGLPMEMESMFLEPLRRAAKAGTPIPRLRRLCDIMQALAKAKHAKAG